MNTLQNKLDDAVLDILFVQLNRNPIETHLITFMIMSDHLKVRLKA
jgi:hypothetical protein